MKIYVDNKLIWLATGLTSFALAGCQNGRTSNEKPNVIFITVDDMNGYGVLDQYAPVRTPNLDKFRDQSINFVAASCTSPVSVPSRASFFSGLYPHSTGAYLNGSDPWKTSPILKVTESIPECFKRNGYDTWGRGKIFHAQLEEGRQEKMFNNRPIFQGGFGPFPEEKNWLGGTRFYAIQPWEEPDTVHPDVVNTSAAISFLEQEHDKPFFLYLGLWRPHCPYNAPKRFFDQYNMNDITLPEGYLKGDLDDVPVLGRELVDSLKKFITAGWDYKELWRKFIMAYCANNTFADWNIGRVLEALDKSKYGKNTIVVFCSDNGYQCGEKERWEKGTLWEASDYVPFMIRFPGVKPAKCVRTVSLVDIYPTLVDYCKLEAPSHKLEGQSMAPLLKDPSARWDRPSLTTYGVQYSSVRDERYRYVRYPDGTEEFYDHSNDPHEFNNLALKPEYKKEIVRLGTFIPQKWAVSLGGRREVQR